MYKQESIALSQKNERAVNEDTVYNNDSLGLYIIADGMKGVNGKEASTFCVDFLSSKIKKAIKHDLASPGAIEDYISDCNKELYNRYLDDIRKGQYGTTLDVVWFDKDNFHVFHVGDSRVYGLNKDGKIKLFTEDDTVGAEKVRDGVLDKKDYEINKFNRGLVIYQPQYEQVTKGIGTNKLDYVFVKNFSIQDYNTILLTTDGITDMVTDNELEEILNKEHNIEIAAQLIMQRAENPKGIVELNMDFNYYKINDLFEQTKYENQIIQNKIKDIHSISEKGRLIQKYFKENPVLYDLLRAAFIKEIKEKDNASLILINNEEEKSGTRRFFGREIFPIRL